MTQNTSNDTGRWSVRKLALVLYPFAAATVAINLFLLGLISYSAGFPSIMPMTAIWLSIPLGIPAAWRLGIWVRSLMDEADGRDTTS